MTAHSIRRRAAIMVVTAAIATTACSLVLDWDPAGLPCLNGECADGFSCLVNKCIADNSLPVRTTCNKDVQCEEGLICAPNLFTCGRPCDETLYYDPGHDCPSGEYCKPLRIESEEGQLRYTGVCVLSDDCRDDAECGLADVCVRISTTAYACLPGCQITWQNGTTYSDNCGSTPSEPVYCQPIGAHLSQRLVCIDTTLQANQIGSGCDPITAPCREGLACINGTCHEHCNSEPGATEQCEINERCCVVPNETQTYGVCALSCDGL